MHMIKLQTLKVAYDVEALVNLHIIYNIQVKNEFILHL